MKHILTPAGDGGQWASALPTQQKITPLTVEAALR